MLHRARRGELRREGPSRLAQLRVMLQRSRGLGRLLAVKFTGQFGDGLYQAALGGAILFNPERQTDPTQIAAGFAVLLLPYSVIGPFAGALLDRWDRRSVLLWANVLRVALILASAAWLASGGANGPLLLLALAAVGVSRFVAAGVSAALPRVVAPRLLVSTNSVLATVGSGCSAAGAGIAVAIISLDGGGDLGSAFVVAVSAIGAAVGAVCAAGFNRDVLGPGRAVARTGDTFRAVAAGLARGAASAWRAPGVTNVLVGIGAHRIVFGVDTLVMVLLLREKTGPSSMGPGGLAGFGFAVTVTAAGMLLAAVVTPVLIPLLGRNRTLVTGLAVAVIVQLTLFAGLERAELFGAAFLLGLAGQVVKLTGDAAMQIDIPDERRGQVFALQDTVFNMMFVLSIAVAAGLVADNPRALVLSAGGVYVLALVLIALNTLARGRGSGRRTQDGTMRGKASARVLRRDGEDTAGRSG